MAVLELPLTRDEVLTPREAAALLRLPESTLREYMRRGVVPARKIGRRWLLSRRELEVWWSERGQPPHSDDGSGATTSVFTRASAGSSTPTTGRSS